jgi:hypothetical protein
MKRRFFTMVQLLLGNLPWAVCPAESFSCRFAEVEQRLRALYPREKGFRIRVSRKRDLWAVYARKGLGSGVAVHCAPVYEAESFSPTRVSVQVGKYSLATLSFRYLLMALVLLLPMLWQLVRFLAPRLLTDPILMAFSPLLFLFALLCLWLLLCLVGWAAEHFLHKEPQLEEVRELVRSVLAADDQVPLPERVLARHSQRALGALGFCVGLIALGIGCWVLWDWWFFWDDPLNIEMARTGVSSETLHLMRTPNLVFGAVLLPLAIVLFGLCALSRQGATDKSPNKPLQTTGAAGRPSEVGGHASGPGG